MTHLKGNILSIIAVSAFIFSGCGDKNEKPEKVTLPSQNIRSIVVDSEGIKWITTDRGTVSYDGIALRDYTNESALNDSNTTMLFSEKNQSVNRIWMCSVKGLSVFETADNAIENYKTYNTGNSGILSDSVFSLDIDSKSTRFVATSSGLSIFSDNKWVDYYGQAGNKILQNYKISGVAADKNNWVYVTTQGGGVSRFQYLDAVSGATTYTHEWASGLKTNNVLTVVVVDDTCQWYGTEKGVALHINELTKSGWTHYSRTDGLICDTVTTIVKDLSGNVWFGTPKGISRLNNDEWVNYTTQNGLVSNQVNTIAVDLDGTVWVGTDKGISHFMNNTWTKFDE